VTVADEVDTLLFDVLGTMVDEAGSMRAELAAALGQRGAGQTGAGQTGAGQTAAGQVGAGQQADALTSAWLRRFDDLVTAIGAGAPWRSTDDLNAEALADVLRDGSWELSEETVRQLGLAGHRLRPWPDSQAALRRLAGRFTVVALSNGNFSMLTEMFAGAGLTWHCVLSGELVHAYKPDPAVYQLALDRLALDPQRTLMVAAHPWDLRAAAVHGLRTAYIERAGEGTPRPSDKFDLTVPDLATLADRLLAGQAAEKSAG
jgi:2-haloacid dehalogenase